MQHLSGRFPFPAPLTVQPSYTSVGEKQLACQLIQSNTNPTERENAIKKIKKINKSGDVCFNYGNIWIIT